jgi:hypothetical protein
LRKNGLKTHAERFMSHNQNAGRSHNTETACAFFENVTKLKYVGASIQNYVHKEEKIKFGE